MQSWNQTTSNSNKSPVYSKLITSVLHVTLTSYYGGSSLLFLEYVIYTCIFKRRKNFCNLLYTKLHQALSNAQQDRLLSDSNIGTRFREFLNPQQVCSWHSLVSIINLLSWCLCFLLYLRNKSVTNEKIYRKRTSINTISEKEWLKYN